MIELFSLYGAETLPYLSDLAQLRIRVFREYPYLYEGSLAYEERYLADYFASGDSVLVVARDDASGAIVGASTAMPLVSADASFQTPVSACGMAISDVYYFGESVLLADYRERGLGHRFFDEREAAARRGGFPITAFCAVMRPENHPERPADYRPLDGFWKKRGYIPHPDIIVELDWREPGQDCETSHQLSYWLREN